jgi:hypothetical protein
MEDFIDFLLTFLLGLSIGAYIGMIALAILMDKNYQKFCPQCGHRFENEETYCINDGAELLTIGGAEE